MKICIIGTGAVGGLLAAHIAQSDHQLTLFDHQEQINTLCKKGLSLISPDGSLLTTKNYTATSELKSCLPQDLIILATKAHQISSLAKDLQPLYHDKTVVITLQNGIPWWYFKKHGCQFDNLDLDCLDPESIISKHISADRIIGCTAYCAAEIKEPGVIHHTEGIRFPLGELDGSTTSRIQHAAKVFTDAGFKSPILTDIRSEIWLKAWGALAFNPISALTHSTLEEICIYPDSRELVKEMMLEAEAIANLLGIKFRVPMEKRINGAQKVGKHKTSMLHDVESGIQLEIEAILGSIIELGTLTDSPTPQIRAVYACSKLLNNTIRHNNLFIHANNKS
ncbi:MAG: oxidoreductase [Gammaproteobacteria bacterium]|nr:MAG: oxidoreductase [Gammaproteobacteria bacterium]